MNLDIEVHKDDLPDEMMFSDKIAVDCEFTGLNVNRDALCLVQISTGKNDAPNPLNRKIIEHQIKENSY